MAVEFLMEVEEKVKGMDVLNLTADFDDVFKIGKPVRSQICLIAVPMTL